MPKETFYNLPEDKQETIIQALLEEFSDYSFAEASVSGIIDRAEIPRGSFYQYFSDLEDAYRFIIKQIAEKKVEYFNQRMADYTELHTMDLLKKLYQLGIEFMQNNPQFAAVGNNFLKEDKQLKNKVYDKYQDLSLQFYRKLIQRGWARDEIDGSLDLEVTSGFLFQLNVYLMNYYVDHYGGEKPLANMNQYLSLVEEMMYILETGIKSKEE